MTIVRLSTAFLLYVIAFLCVYLVLCYVLYGLLLGELHGKVAVPATVLFTFLASLALLTALIIEKRTLNPYADWLINSCIVFGVLCTLWLQSSA